MSFVLLLGGARSGKSAMAKRLAVESGAPVTFIATAESRDDEMAERIRRHQEERVPDWRTIESPLDLSSAVRSAPAGDYLVVDCLTLWVSNLLEAGADGTQIGTVADQVIHELAGRNGVVVSNEVGLGIVPMNELARTYRDVLGAVNSAFAAAAARAVLMVAGRALDLADADAVVRGN